MLLNTPGWSITIALVFAADRGGPAVQNRCNESDAETGLTKGMNAISVVQVQVSCGNVQLHSAVKSLRLNCLNPFTAAVVALRS